MQALQRTVQKILEQMKGLSPTAKMLLGSLMIIMAMSLFLVSLYAGRQNMTPLGLGANVTADARARAVNYLKTSGMKYEVSGTDIMVPAEQKYAVLAYLTESQVIGADQINFDRLMNDDSPFRTRDQNRQRYLVAKMNVLASMISQMTGIERATVVLDASDSTSLGKSHVPSSASVTVMTRGSDLGQTQVDAIARLVAGSHAGLKPQNVAIIDSRTGRFLQASTEETIGAGRYMQVKLDAEQHVKSTIENALGFIPGVRIAVNAQVDAKQVVQQTSKYDEPKVGVVDEMTHSISSSGAGGGSEPGVQANTGKSISVAAKSGSQLTDEKSTTSSIPFVGTNSSKINDNKGYALQINASIGVPKSYFVRLFQDQKGDAAKQPDQAELDALIQKETDRIKAHVTPLIDTKAMEGAVAGTVAVSMIPDFGAIASREQASPELAGTGGILSDGLVKYVSLGGLAVVSLAMMFMMVRKAGARTNLPSASELIGIPPALSGTDGDLVGEADEAAPAMEGVELTDDTVRRQQMLDQITEMVSAAPDDAAGLFRRWMKTEA